MLVPAPRRNATTEFKESWCSVHGRPFVMLAQFYHDRRVVDFRQGRTIPGQGDLKALPNGGFRMRRGFRDDPSLYRVLWIQRDDAELGGLPESELLICPHCKVSVSAFICENCGFFSCIGSGIGRTTCFNCRNRKNHFEFMKFIMSGQGYLRYEREDPRQDRRRFAIGSF